MSLDQSNVVVIREGVLAGLRAKIIARSGRTGTLTVELLEERNAYKIGSRAHVMPYEVERFHEA